MADCGELLSHPTVRDRVEPKTGIMLDQMKDALDPPIRDYRIFFLHIAKCGGTSIANAIEKCYKPWRPGNARTVVSLHENAARFAEAHAVSRYLHVRRDILNYMMALPQVRCITGHFQYSNAAHEVLKDQWHFVTVLRDPVARWLSHYRYNSGKGRISVPIEEFLETAQARSFGRAFVDEITEDLDKEAFGIDELIGVALMRYRKFSIVGTIENTQGFAREFEERFGRRLRVPHLNRTPAHHAHESIGGAVMQKIEELCEPDIRLHAALFPERPEMRCNNR